MGESEIRPQRLCPSLRERVGARCLRQAAGSLRRVPNQSFIPVTDEVIEAHLRGEDRVRHNGRGNFVAGVYPLLFDDTCRFLAVDFDD
jgi:hypothetical protein